MKPEQHELRGSDEASLLAEHDPEAFTQRSRRRPQNKTSFPSFSAVLSILTFILTLLAIALLVTLLHRQQQNNHHGKVSLNDSATNLIWKDCGNSSSEAHAKGCLFDVMLVTWIHADCFDPELHESYLQKHTFPFWRDPDMTDNMPLEEVRLGEYELIYTNLDYHFVHCGYAWEMILRAYRRGKAIESELWAMGHTVHCVHNLVDRPPWDKDRTKLYVGFETCGKPYF